MQRRTAAGSHFIPIMCGFAQISQCLRIFVSSTLQIISGLHIVHKPDFSSFLYTETNLILISTYKEKLS